MRQLLIPHSMLLLALLLSACTRDVGISTVVDDAEGLRPGDKVYLAAREVGTVTSVATSEQTPGVTIELGLYPEHAELVQSNAVAYVPLKSPPSVVLLNPAEAAPPVEPGAHLKGLSPLGAVVWQANDAAAAATALVDQFTRQMEDYFESDDWARTRANIDAEIAGLAEDSKHAADRVVEELQQLLEGISEAAPRRAETLDEDTAAIEREIDRLDAEGHHDLAASRRRLLKQVEAWTPPATASPDTSTAPETATEPRQS